MASSDSAASRLLPTPCHGQSVGAHGTCWIKAGHTVRPSPTTSSRYAPRRRYSWKSDTSGGESTDTGANADTEDMCTSMSSTAVLSVRRRRPACFTAADADVSDVVEPHLG